MGRVPLAGLIQLILLIHAIERDIPADRIVWHVQKGDPNRYNMADALATYLRRVSLQITAAVSNCVTKIMHFVVNMMLF